MKLKVYEPREDSFLLRDQVLKFASGKVLDMGTGSGIQAIAASSRANSVLAVDINSYSLSFAKSQAKGVNARNIKFVKSNLFSNVKGFFDVIIFNPPYLPSLKGEPKDLARQISGGKKGYELIERFFSKVDNFLNKNGKILMVFSSASNKEKVNEIIEDHGFNFRIVSVQNVGFEELFVYVIERSQFLDILKNKGLKQVKKFAKGHRGVIYVGKFKSKKIAIKTKLLSSDAVGNIEREAKWLKLLNTKNIGPKLFFTEKDFFGYEFIDGVFIKDFILKARKPGIKKILIEVLHQCFILDQLAINKEEMHHPIKHVIISKKNNKKVVMIDFERASKCLKPHNVPQFCQYIINHSFDFNKKHFKIDKNKIIQFARVYKEDICKKNLDNIIRCLN